MPAPRLTIQLVGLRRVLRATDPEYLLGHPVREVLDEIASQGADRARSVGPRGETGQLTARITHRVSPADIPRWAVVKTDARSRRGYSYPRLLEFSGKHGHRDWLRKAVLSGSRGLRGAVNQLGRLLKERWRRA